MDKYESLKLENQLCFPLYACSKEIIRLYKPYLDKLDLTYTQYITMLIMWEHEKITSHELGEKLYLDSGTLTPLLKKLESKNYIKRERSKTDERNLNIELTIEGKKLKETAINSPSCICECVPLDDEEKKILSKTLNKLMSNLKYDNK